MVAGDWGGVTVLPVKLNASEKMALKTFLLAEDGIVGSGDVIGLIGLNGVDGGFDKLSCTVDCKSTEFDVTASTKMGDRRPPSPHPFPILNCEFNLLPRPKFP
jgi:hypothetical protein